jgi:hypothetical protein
VLEVEDEALRVGSISDNSPLSTENNAVFSGWNISSCHYKLLVDAEQFSIDPFVRYFYYKILS